MKISTKGRYAIRMLLDLAEHSNGEYIALRDIAHRQGISKKYLEQIVPILNKSDILKTNRGYQGGYMLAKSPGQIPDRGHFAPDRGKPRARRLCRRKGRLPEERGLYDSAALAGALQGYKLLS